MPFIAECPFCQGKLRAPDSAVGRSLSCPKCGEPFTLAPMEHPPQSATFTIMAAAQGTTTTLPGTQTAAPLPPLPLPESAPPPTEEDGDRPRRPLNPVAVLAFFLAGAGWLSAAVASTFILDAAARLALVGAGLAVLVGLVGLLLARATRLGGFWLSLAATGASLPLLVLLLVRPAWLGIFAAPAPPGNTTAVRTVVIPVGKETPEAHSEEESEPEWVDVRGKELQQGDLRVRVVSLLTRFVELKQPTPVKPPPRRFLVVGLRIFNVGVARRLHYQSWGEKANGTEDRQARLTDESGKSYPLVNFAGAEVAGRVREKNLPPGTRVDDVLVFESPPNSVSSLRLELPAEAAGGSGTFKLRIPREAITVR
jgi:hypothetical protein